MRIPESSAPMLPCRLFLFFLGRLDEAVGGMAPLLRLLEPGVKGLIDALVEIRPLKELEGGGEGRRGGGEKERKGGHHHHRHPMFLMMMDQKEMEEEVLVLLVLEEEEEEVKERVRGQREMQVNPEVKTRL